MNYLAFKIRNAFLLKESLISLFSEILNNRSWDGVIVLLFPMYFCKWSVPAGLKWNLLFILMGSVSENFLTLRWIVSYYLCIHSHRERYRRTTSFFCLYALIDEYFFFCQAFLGTIPFKGDLIRLMCRKSVWSTRRAISWHKTLPHYGRRRSSKIASDSSESLEKKDQLKGIIRDFELGTERLNPYRKKTKSSVVTSLEPQYPYFFLIASEN